MEFESIQSQVEMQPPVFFNAPRRISRWMLLASVLITALAGCRSRAQRDLYQAKMAHEIRVLEDQLYEADYHNRVLIDRIESLRLKSMPRSESPGVGSYDSRPRTVPSPTAPQVDRAIPEPIRDPIPNGDSGSTTPVVPVPNDLPSIEIGSPVSPPAADVTTPRAGEAGGAAPAAPKSLEQIDEIGPMVEQGQPVKPAESTKTPKSEATPAEPPADEILPAPGGPEPPGRRDTEIPPILPGEVLPPALPGPTEDIPPGQIELPDSVQQGMGIPKQLRLHPSLSGGVEVEGKIDQMVLVVNVLDESGRTLDLNQYQVEGELSVVLFEPDREANDDSRIGRWDFASEQVRELVMSEPVSGLHIPIQWQERQPAGEEMIVHVRLRSEGDEMRCEGRVRVRRANAVAEWTPRGSSLK